MAMSVELDATYSVDPLSGEHLATCCRPSYRVKWVKNKGALLIIAWNYLVMSVYYLFRAGINLKEKHLEDPSEVTDTGIILCCMAILSPIGGWLADTHIGRYKVIHYSMWIMWIGVVLATVGDLVLSNVSVAHHTQINRGIYLFLCCFMMIGLGGFLSNIIHLGVDQLIDASATEITSFITWYTMTVYASGIAVHYITDCVVVIATTFYLKTLFVAICLSLALCLDFLFQHVLVKEQVTGKSLRVIVRVIMYTIRNRHFGHSLPAVAADNTGRSWFNVAKHMYGGPFTSQQVDNVQKFLSVLMIAALCATVIGAMEPIEYAKEKVEAHLKVWHDTHEVPDIGMCYKNLTIRYSNLFFATVTILLYEFVVHPLFHRCLPKIRIATAFLLGVAMFLLWLLSLLAIEIVVYRQQLLPVMVEGDHNATLVVRCAIMKRLHINISYEWWFIPSFLDGLSHFILLSSALQFIWAQTPSSMKGLMLGLVYMFVGLSTLIHTGLGSPFIVRKFASHVSWEHAPLTCDIWYFLLEGVIILVVLIVSSVLVRKCNGGRQRNTQYHVESYTSSE